MQQPCNKSCPRGGYIVQLNCFREVLIQLYGNFITLPNKLETECILMQTHWVECVITYLI